MSDRPLVDGHVSRNGDTITYYERVSVMHLLPNDNRAEVLRRKKGFTQKAVWNLWSDIIYKFKPCIIYDIGANHGEMSLPLSPSFPCRIELFEPNPYLSEILKRSIETHQVKECFKLHQVAISDFEGSINFNIDKKWSGTSSIDFKSQDKSYKGEGAQIHEEVNVEVTTLDAVNSSNTAASIKLVAAKFDIEGHEFKAILGAQKTTALNFVFVLEFSDSHLIAAKSDPAEMMRYLQEIGVIFFIGKNECEEIVKGKHLPRDGNVLVTNVLEIIDYVKSHHCR